MHHGTILFNSDLDVLSSALNVDEEKLKARSIKSTRSRVVNLKSLINEDIGVSEFIDRISEYVKKKFNPDIISAPKNVVVESLKARNESPEWIFPERAYLSEYRITKKKKYDFGLIELCLLMSNETISDIKIFGDFFGVKDISEVEELLRGSRISEIQTLISSVSLNDYILGMTNSEFIELIKE